MFDNFFYMLEVLFSKRRFHTVQYKNKTNTLIIHLTNGKTIRNPKYVHDVRVHFTGKNSTVELYEPYHLEEARLYPHNHDYFLLRKVEGNIRVVGGDDTVLKIDEGTTLNNTKIYLNSERHASCSIGKDCMFSFDVAIWASDTHQIFEQKTHKYLNRMKYGIEIGNHVWCGTRVTILKDTKVSDNSVIGAGSVCCHRFTDTNVVVAGNPANIIKKHIDWAREGYVNI